MIDFGKIKMVLFDFDDTLAIHEWHDNSPEEQLKYDKSVLTDGAGAWSHLRPSRHMSEFMKSCAEANIKMGLISAGMSFQHLKGKADWVKEVYGYKLENYCVGRVEAKLDMMIALAEAYEIPRNQILIVDDYWLTLERAANAGFMAASPMEVVNFVESDAYIRYKCESKYAKEITNKEIDGQLDKFLESDY